MMVVPGRTRGDLIMRSNPESPAQNLPETTVNPGSVREFKVNFLRSRALSHVHPVPGPKAPPARHPRPLGGDPLRTIDPPLLSLSGMVLNNRAGDESGEAKQTLSLKKKPD